jgi:putative heme iron utilization protein
MSLEESLDQIKDSVIAHMNDDHCDANLVYAKALAGLTDALSAEMTDFDRHGISLAAEGPNGVSEVRVAFLEPLAKAEDIRPALIKLLKYAREQL